jgi:hypothetical protein
VFPPAYPENSDKKVWLSSYAIAYPAPEKLGSDCALQPFCGKEIRRKQATIKVSLWHIELAGASATGVSKPRKKENLIIFGSTTCGAKGKPWGIYLPLLEITGADRF